MHPSVVAHQVLIDRRTGKVIRYAGEIHEQDWVYKDIHPDHPLIRYMTFDKFADLLRTSELYFRRADKFDDTLEGTLSREGIHGTSQTDQSFTRHVPLSALPYSEQSSQQRISTGCYFVNCWHINHELTPMMWDAYANAPDSVAVITRRSKLDRAIAQAMMKHPVTYVNSEQPRTKLGEASLLLYKDEIYAYEKEFRLIASMEDLGTHSIRCEDPNDFFRRVPVNLRELIEKIAPNPYALGSTKRAIGNFISQHAPYLQDNDTIFKILQQ